ncbi:MAG: phosphodiester glycosidase family protein [Anaerolineales bacterium]|nr:phosphodiester glycosidase family protein [Chloroflexota bacterium]MBL6983457.1 phosphodiester glycosidase family protein [Anaerolineales bacterium]
MEFGDQVLEFDNRFDRYRDPFLAFERDFLDIYVSALNTKSSIKVAELYHPNCALVNSSQTLVGKTRVRALYQRLFTEELSKAFIVNMEGAGTGNIRTLRWIARDRPSYFNASGSGAVFKGIQYRKMTRTLSRPHKVYVASIDLNNADIEMVVTPPDGLGKTTSDFMTHFGLQLAVNGDEWLSWSNPKGLAVSEGLQYSASSAEPSVYISAANQVQVGGPPPTKLWNAISGSHTLVRNGQVNRKLRTCSKPDVYCQNLAPRTSLGLTSGNKLILTVVQGPSDSLRDALTLKDLANLNIELGAKDAISLDGGGSSTMAVNDYGIPRILNSPSDGKERVVSNHLGVRAGYLEGGANMQVGESNDTFGLVDGKIVYHFMSLKIDGAHFA